MEQTFYITAMVSTSLHVAWIRTQTYDEPFIFSLLERIKVNNPAISAIVAPISRLMVEVSTSRPHKLYPSIKTTTSVKMTDIGEATTRMVKSFSCLRVI